MVHMGSARSLMLVHGCSRWLTWCGVRLSLGHMRRRVNEHRTASVHRRHGVLHHRTHQGHSWWAVLGPILLRWRVVVLHDGHRRLIHGHSATWGGVWNQLSGIRGTHNPRRRRRSRTGHSRHPDRLSIVRSLSIHDHRPRNRTWMRVHNRWAGSVTHHRRVCRVGRRRTETGLTDGRRGESEARVSGRRTSG